MQHVTVLRDEAIDVLALSPDSVVVDCTFGGGGHSKAILEQLGPNGQLYSFDVDGAAFALSELTDERMICVNANFRDLKQALDALGVTQVDAILADLGWRSDQFDSGSKGFSFTSTEPISMTFGKPEDYTFTAYDVVNEWDEESIADIIYGYGEERAARMIASAIVIARNNEPIKTAADLAAIIEASVGRFYRTKKIHPATKTFQAIRMAVNDELGALKQLMADGFELLAPEGRMAVISFHSLEDRLVKQTFKQYKHDQRGELITKKPIVPSRTEIKDNPRARSAKLRALAKLPHES